MSRHKGLYRGLSKRPAPVGRRHFSFIFLICLIVLNPCLQVPANADRFIMSTGAKEPYSTTQQDGFLDRVAQEIFSRLDHQARVLKVPAKRAIHDTNKGIYDGDMQRIAGLEETFPNLIPIREPIHHYEFTAFSRTPDQPGMRLEDMHGMTIGYLRGWKYYDSHLPQDNDVILVDTPEALLRLLVSGRIELALFHRWSGIYWAKKLGLEVYPLDVPLGHMDMYMYVHKRHKALVPQLTRQMSAIKTDGTYMKIWEATLDKTD